MAENIRLLAVKACQYLLEHGGDEVAFKDLVGEGQSLPHLEPVAGESYEGVSFALTADGLFSRLGGKNVPAVEGEPFAIQVAPAQSLSAISRQLRIPLATLQRLNPRHAASDRISEWTSVRLH